MKKIYPEIHFFRIAACLMVIIIHTTATPVVTLIPNSIPQLFFTILNRFSKPSVPMFVFMSGFLLSMLYRDKTMNPLVFWKKRLPKLLLPYILWATLYYSLFAIRGIYPFNFSFYIKGLLQGNFIYHLYFMIIIIQFYVGYPLLHYLQKKVGDTNLFLIALGLQLSTLLITLPLQDRLMTTYISYFVLGMLMTQAFDLKLKSPLYYLSAFVIMGSLYTYQFIGYTNNGLVIDSKLSALTYIVFSLLTCFALLMAFRSFTPVYAQHRSKIDFLSQSTLTLYYAHPLILILIGALLDMSSMTSISLRAFISFIAVFIILIPIFSLYAYAVRMLSKNHL
ncbi:acyltransferase [Fusibacter sp. 3D3]|uniref:acyltransferase n=1 Tax=Fusibacter sp. 3D3 TaxID=1048380 RepID=UPI0008538F36|nr:acyltransferase [Fusibacter sp. 3D3]GAU76784.1 integral membrane protein [Fusibacter sp. 3D3]